MPFCLSPGSSSRNFFSSSLILTLYSPLEASLFDLEVILQRKSKKIADSILRDEKFRTEGGSDDEHIQRRWEELLKQDSDDEGTSYSPQNMANKEVKTSWEERIPVEKKENFYQSFFRKPKDDADNQDLVNVFAADRDEDNEVEDLEDSEISEKFRNETLKVSSHGTPVPKTKTSLHEKFRFIFNKTEPERVSSYGRLFQNTNEVSFRASIQGKKGGDNIHSLKERGSYKFMQNLNGQHIDSKTKESEPNELAKRNYSEPEPCEYAVRDTNSKKIMKYARKKQNLFSKPMVAIEEISFKDENVDPEQNIPKEADVSEGRKSSRKGKHERIRSFDFSNKLNVENFFDTLLKREE